MSLFGFDGFEERELLAICEREQRELEEDLERARIERMQEKAARVLLYPAARTVAAAPVLPPLRDQA